MLCEVEREVAPLWVVAWQQHGLASEYIWIKFKVGIYLTLNIVVLSVELIVFSGLSRRKGFICHCDYYLEFILSKISNFSEITAIN